MSRLRLGEILVQAGVLEQSALDRALQEQRRWGRGPLGQYLVQLGLVSEEMIVRALSKQCNIPAVALDPERLELSAARFVPDDICQRHRLVCFKVDRERRFLDVAMADPASLDAVDEVRVATRYNVRPYFALPSAIERALVRVFEGAPSLGSLPVGRPGAPGLERAAEPVATRPASDRDISFDEVSLAEVGALDLLSAAETAAPGGWSGGASARPGAGAPLRGQQPVVAPPAVGALGRGPDGAEGAMGPSSAEHPSAALGRDDRGVQVAQLERQLRAQTDRLTMLLQILRTKGMLNGDDLSRLGG